MEDNAQTSATGFLVLIFNLVCQSLPFHGMWSISGKATH